ncbi:hypothetical protein WJX79_002247 [Trebouxia sp. C0005]
MAALIHEQPCDVQLAEGPWYTRAGLVQGASGFELLPEANLRQLLALLPLSQRIRSAELVSKQWRQALLDQQVLSVLDFARDDLWRCQVSTTLLDHLIARSTKAYKQGIQDSPTKKVILTNCHQVAGAGPPMAFEHCLCRCPHLEVVEATGFGGVKGAFHLNDLLKLLRTLNKMRPAPELKEVWVDAWCPQLTDTWESSAYQRAIAVDALWLTFMRMLEPASRIKVRNIICTDSLGDRLRPSEVVRTLTMRLRNLEAALSKASHHMQVVFVVSAAVEKSLVEQVMGRSTRVECRDRSSAPAHEAHVFTVQNLHC